jgi:hypothetical protein
LQSINETISQKQVSLPQQELKSKFVLNINHMVLVLKKGATRDEVAALEKNCTVGKR